MARWTTVPCSSCLYTFRCMIRNRSIHNSLASSGVTIYISCKIVFSIGYCYSRSFLYTKRLCGIFVSTFPIGVIIFVFLNYSRVNIPWFNKFIHINPLTCLLLVWRKFQIKSPYIRKFIIHLIKINSTFTLSSHKISIHRYLTIFNIISYFF